MDKQDVESRCLKEKASEYKFELKFCIAFHSLTYYPSLL